MATATKTVTELPAWKTLSAHFQKIDRLHLRELFARDPKRGERLTVEGVGLYLDYSKHRVTDETMRLIRATLKDWGCDCIFFFNYNRINPGIGNLSVEEHMDALFGKKRADALRDRFKMKRLQPHERRLTGR
jgi:hypothetical protein